MTVALPWVRRTEWGANLFKGPVNKMAKSNNNLTPFQKSKLGKFNAGNNLRTNNLKGPWSNMAPTQNGPINRFKGPVNNMGTAGYGSNYNGPSAVGYVSVG